MEKAWELAALILMASRPKIPAAMQRSIKEEAGYRCAIPTCRDKGPFDFEHIEDWAQVKKHELHNIILLCVGCHARVTRGEILKSAIKTYKRNLAIISGRYSLYEMRLLESYSGRVSVSDDGEPVYPMELTYFVNHSSKIHILGLLKDKLLKENPLPKGGISDSEKVIAKLRSTAKTSPTPLVTAMVATLESDRNKELIRSLIRGIEGNPTRWIFPTSAGVKFINDYFSGKEIE